MRFYIIISLAILFISYNGCFKIKGGFSSHSDSRKEQPKRDEKFSYIFERRGRRNPFIGEGILITPHFFTVEALNTASGTQLELINGKRLIELLKENNLLK
ncbi:MAG: hypothetical protein ACK4NF_01840 [Planctomycetota bacterium]